MSLLACDTTLLAEALWCYRDLICVCLQYIQKNRNANIMSVVFFLKFENTKCCMSNKKKPKTVDKACVG